jgi:hypothetical protein
MLYENLPSSAPRFFYTPKNPILPLKKKETQGVKKKRGGLEEKVTQGINSGIRVHSLSMK